MHDTFLMERIYEEMKRLCHKNNIIKLELVVIGVNKDSHIDEEEMHYFLEERYDSIIGLWTDILIKKEEIEDNTAIIYSLIGEKNEHEIVEQ